VVYKIKKFPVLISNPETRLPGNKTTGLTPLVLGHWRSGGKPRLLNIMHKLFTTS
jgi:hypothetical protein